MMDVNSETASNGNKTFNPKVRWVIPQRLDLMTFVGRDVLAIAHDIYILFINLKTHAEHVYVANDVTRGDGVDAVAGHRGHLFAFAEKVMHARIFIVTYPTFHIITELKDTDVNRYKGLCMMECDLVAGFSGFPDYLISVWNWRTRHRLLSLPTGVIRRSQIYMASRSHMLICECWGEGLIVWEVVQCYKKCFMLKRPIEEKTGWEVSVPPHVGVCWTSEGQLYTIDPMGNLYSILSDGIGMVAHLEWSEELKGTCKPSVCTFGNGILLYGPDNCLRLLKKSESKWKVVFKLIPHDEVVRLVSNSSNDLAAMWTSNGAVYRVTGVGEGEGEGEDHLHVTLFAHKQRFIKTIQMIAPDCKNLATMNDVGVLCVYDILSTKLVIVKYVEGTDISFKASPVDPLLVVYGEVGTNYGMGLFGFSPEGLQKVGSVCLTNQVVSEVVFSPTGRHLVAAAMSAGHIFIYNLSEAYKLTLVRYAELGRGLADCFLMSVGQVMRAFSLVLFSDNYAIGERIICINAETGRDNKFAGKMQGPYQKLVPLSTTDTMLGIPHLSKQYHLLKLAADKGVTVSVKMGPIIDSGHDIKSFYGFHNFGALLTYGYDGNVIFRQPDAPEEYELKLSTSHRYESGVRQAVVDAASSNMVHCGRNSTVACVSLHGDTSEPAHQATPLDIFDEKAHTITIIGEMDKNYLDLQEEKKVHEEAMDYKRQRDEVVKTYESIRTKLVDLLEENLAAVPLHQLSLSEFNLHLEHKKERLKQAEKEREMIRLETEARIMAQDKVTDWIKKQCWDTMLTPRVKLFAIFSHYQVENYAVLPTQRDNWPELQQIEALRSIEMENDADLFKPWEEPCDDVVSVAKSHNEQRQGSLVSMRSARRSADSGALAAARAAGDAARALEREVRGEGEDAHAHPLAASGAHRCVPLPRYMVTQAHAYSFLHMNWLQHIVKLNVQSMRLWFNKQFDELMSLKKREVGLVEERNSRLRFIIEELNKLSELRGSFHHLTIEIKDPEWRQEEQPMKLIKVEPEECSIEPYVSPSQVLLTPPEPTPADDFKERALLNMMDGVLEKLWHEEIKKPIPVPLCMLEKDPEHFNEEDLRVVFDYESKVAFRNEERDKYRKMLHAEYGKLAQLLNEGIVKFNQKVKETWLTKLKTDSVIGQENLSLMRLRRTNLDRVEMAEKLEDMRAQISKYEGEVDVLMHELHQIQEQSAECQAGYDALTLRDKHLDKTFKNHFADLSPIIVDQCYKFFKKRPKCHHRATMTPVVLYELANAVLSGVKPPLLHADCLDFFKGVDHLDLISNMPPVIDEGLWTTMCKLRRAKIENEIRMRALAQEMSYVESANNVWTKALQTRRNHLASLHHMMVQHRAEVEATARNKTIQLVLPAGQVEITTSGHIEDFEDAALILREDIEKINNVILKVGEMKLRMMRKQMEFRKGILSKEWEHAQVKMKLRHMEQELQSYQRLKIPKELQLYLKNKELGYTDEQDYVRMEKEMEASKMAVNKILNDQIHRVEELEVKLNALETQTAELERLIAHLNVKVSEKKLNEDPLEPIRIRRVFKKRMETLVMRGELIRDVQANHTTIVVLQTELELLRLKTYPTLASFRTFT